MHNGNRSVQIVRFGRFEADLQTGELRKDGVKLALQVQPFQVLAILLKNSGGLVTREHLQSQVWPKDTFVDFDHALNTAITKIRLALGDDAEHPIFVETLPRRGYRFIGPMDEADSGTNSAGKSKRHLDRLSAPKILIALGVTLAVLLCSGIWSISRNIPTPKVIDSVQMTKDGQHKDVTLKLLNDGSRLYFQEGTFIGPLSTVAPVFAENPSLVQVSTLGGETARIPVSLEDPLIYDLSPARSEFLVGGGGNQFEHPLWALPLPTGPPRRVGNILALDACWSPDGKHLAFVKGNEIFVANPDGTELRKLVTLDFPAYWIRYSPDGTRLRFTVFTLSGHPEDWNIMEIGADGSGLRQLPVHGCCGKWSADGNYYFYQTSRDIWVLPERRTFLGGVELGTPAQLTTGPIAFGAPTPSSDGKGLFVVGNLPRVELVRYERKEKQFVPFLAGISAGELEVSPDGQWVTYTTYPESNLWRSKLDGSERLQLTFPPVNAHEPRWSPDGKQILFTDVPRRMFIVSTDGGILEPVMPKSELPTTEVGAGFWTPDANSIVFVMGSDKTPYAIYRLSLKTQEVSKIPGSDGLVAARLSPNGRYVTGHGPDKTMLYDFETQQWSDFGDGIPAWSHDSKFVYLHRKKAHQSEVVRMRVPDGKVERVLDLKGITLGGYWPDWVSLLPDDSPLLMLDKSTQEIYRLQFQHY
jgi:Tol biopolymer transport system component/DNA-binding winged helix-turn-helix (wHTH) protein